MVVVQVPAGTSEAELCHFIHRQTDGRITAAVVDRDSLRAELAHARAAGIAMQRMSERLGELFSLPVE